MKGQGRFFQHKRFPPFSSQAGQELLAIANLLKQQLETLRALLLDAKYYDDWVNHKFLFQQRLQDNIQRLSSFDQVANQDGILNYHQTCHFLLTAVKLLEDTLQATLEYWTKPRVLMRRRTLGDLSDRFAYDRKHPSVEMITQSLKELYSLRDESDQALFTPKAPLLDFLASLDHATSLSKPFKP